MTGKLQPQGGLTYLYQSGHFYEATILLLLSPSLIILTLMLSLNMAIAINILVSLPLIPHSQDLLGT